MTYAIYVIVIEDTNDAFESLMQAPGIVNWEQPYGEIEDEQEAIALAGDLTTVR